MTAFLLAAILMTATALAFVLPALLGKQNGGSTPAPRDQVNLAVLRDQLHELDGDLAAGIIDADAHRIARRELAQRLAEDVPPIPPMYAAAPGKPLQAIAIALAVVAGATALYAQLGTPAGLDPARTAAAPALDRKDVDAMVERLVQQLKAEPENAEGWLILARSLSAMGRFADASGAYKHLMTLTPDNAQVLAEYAGNLAMTQGESLRGEPEKLLARAMEIDPKNTKALALIGSAAFERGDYAAAIAYWEKILTLAPADSTIARVASDNIKEARAAETEQPPLPSQASAVSAAGTAASTSSSAPQATQVAGTVELDPALRAEVRDTDTVFIFARAADGPRFPLAVLRKQVRDLPARFVLDDSMSMMPDAKLSGFASLTVGARISKTGSATPGAGDLEGSVTSVRPGAKDIKITIGSRRG